ncbi:hypothetical protein A3F00_02830 [Candidatus Daviesbacteria bacterium RIFCSPHIGHO2_12_FULL_37_11]|uniref:Uncharacterized protein n=1 Tax=Candidatus Daviesbacteria bacterium RIFCSPHIGHO2_12_FULL_37_11 TaxID=1797777 RepID=A0A1F5K992_9BACT|nr:MAG: hypothetical protein A3F00_02830 [Candidatus Daviesbacteria bacterium RIFCSPHIGHO2_12_FULL_37_11]OGE45551.1 MAG: hypothetical protein A3B39_05065 [Candidatus Daviesbacteria bacterium RIFCSPLOWO2_01_FULL_37_10]
MGKEMQPVETEFHVITLHDGKAKLFGIETYPGERELKDAIQFNHTENRNRLLFGTPSLLFSIAGLADFVQRAAPYVSALGNLKVDANTLGIGAEFVTCGALLCYSFNSLTQIDFKAREIDKVEAAFRNPKSEDELDL